MSNAKATRSRPADETESTPATNLERLLAGIQHENPSETSGRSTPDDPDWLALRRKIEDGSAFPWFLRQQ